VLIHGFPPDGRSWEKQAKVLLAYRFSTGYIPATYAGSEG
jgi:hypothetical protein